MSRVMRLLLVRPAVGAQMSQMSSVWLVTTIMIKWRIHVCWQGDNPESKGSRAKVGRRFWSRCKVSRASQLAIHIVSIPITLVFFSVLHSSHPPAWHFLHMLPLLLFFTFVLCTSNAFMSLPSSFLASLFNFPFCTVTVFVNYIAITTDLQKFVSLALQKKIHLL